MENVIISNKVMVSQTVAASGSADSSILDLNELGARGDISVQYEITGNGTCKIEWLQTNDGESKEAAINFVLPSGGYELANTLTKTSGTDSNGKDLLALSTAPSKYLKLRVTETGTVSSVIVTLIVTTD